MSIQYSSLGFNLHVKALYILDLGLVKEDILFSGQIIVHKLGPHFLIVIQNDHYVFSHSRRKQTIQTLKKFNIAFTLLLIH